MKIRNSILLAAYAFLVSCTSLCPDPPSVPTATIGDLQPGEYRLLLTATDGSREGQQVQGRLWLIKDPTHWSASKIYGTADISLDRVGAPITADSPSSMSLDPNVPGVLVVDSVGPFPPETPVLLIGTASNRNPVIGHDSEGNEILQMTADGPGIGLWVYRISPKWMVGRWSEWGMLADGHGTFCASRVPGHLQ